MGSFALTTVFISIFLFCPELAPEIRCFLLSRIMGAKKKIALLSNPYGANSGQRSKIHFMSPTANEPITSILEISSKCIGWASELDFTLSK